MHFDANLVPKARQYNYTGFKDTFCGTNSKATLLARFVEKPIPECTEKKIKPI